MTSKCQNPGCQQMATKERWTVDRLGRRHKIVRCDPCHAKRQNALFQTKRVTK